jgi:zinc transport system substrate-binding protein
MIPVILTRLAACIAAAGLVMPIGCGPGRTTAEGSGGRTRISIVASFYPLAEAARVVGDGLVEVSNLTPPGVEPHDLELDPEQVVGLAEADIVLYAGRALQPAVEDAVRSVAEGTAVDVLAGMPAPAADGGAVAADPHVWLDPVLMQRIVGVVEGAIVRALEEGDRVVHANADAYRSRIAELAQDYRAGLSRCRLRELVTSHAAFGYLARRYGLVERPITGVSTGAEPDPSTLAELAATVARDGTTTIFLEPLASPRAAQTLAREAGVRTAVLNPIEGLTEEEIAQGHDYVSLMRANLAALRKGLACE